MTTYDRDLEEPVLVRSAERTLADASKTALYGRPLVSQSIANLRPYPSGTPLPVLARTLGMEVEDLLLLSANENMLGPSPLGIAAAQAALTQGQLYPDGGCNALKQKLAAKLAVPTERLVVSNGSNELIELIIRTFVAPDETVVVAWPSFVVYRLAAQAHERDTLIAPLTDDRRLDLEALRALVDHRTKVVFLANPNNPTGTHVGGAELTAFLDRLPPHVLVVLDEAYYEYVDAPDFVGGLELSHGRPRVIVLRTFSKAYGLAGLRIGYGVMDPELADYLERVRQPYNVNAIAQAAATAALDDAAHVEASREMVIAGRAQYASEVESFGVRCLPSQANFVVLDLGCDALIVQDILRSQGILVRALAGYGLATCLRITIGPAEVNQRVIDALGEALARGGRFAAVQPRSSSAIDLDARGGRA